MTLIEYGVSFSGNGPQGPVVAAFCTRYPDAALPSSLADELFKSAVVLEGPTTVGAAELELRFVSFCRPETGADRLVGAVTLTSGTEVGC